MNRTISLIILLLSIFSLAHSTPNDSVKTYYKNGYFVTYCKVWVNTNEAVMSNVVNDYVHQTKYDLDKLYGWALKGMKLRNEGDNLIIMNFKSTKYDSFNNIVRGIGDVEIPGIICFPDTHVDSRITKAKLANKSYNITIDVLKSDAFLRKTKGIFYAVPHQSGGYWITLETKVQFGWFFNVFITQPVFKGIMEWRFHKLLLNIKDEAERRTNETKPINSKVTATK